MVTNTIPENEYQDCVEELTKKLNDERKLSSEQNTRIAELEEEIGQMIAFNVAFEALLEERKDMYEPKQGERSIYSHERLRGFMVAYRNYHKLKAQHLEAKESEDDG